MNLDKKLEHAQQILLKLIETDKTGFDAEGIAAYAWEIADAMQAEEEKRNGGVPEAIQEASKEWQPDWSQAPDDRIDHWSKESNESATWWIGEPTKNIGEGTHHDNDDCICAEDAPTFNYQGDWKNSLRKRPNV